MLSIKKIKKILIYNIPNYIYFIFHATDKQTNLTCPLIITVMEKIKSLKDYYESIKHFLSDCTR